MKPSKTDSELTSKLLHDGFAHQQAGRWQEAETLYHAILKTQPQHIDALQLLGVIAHEKGENKTAVNLIEKAIAINPNVADFYYNCGVAYRALQNNDLAIHRFEQAIAIKPNDARAYNKLAVYLQELGQYEEAITHLEKAITLKPDYAAAHNNLGNILKKVDRYDHAITSFEKAITLKPNDAMAHHNLAMTYLQTGDFEKGWKEYEWRYETKEYSIHKHNYTQPLWDGSPLEGKTILVHAEQGFGDTIQFIRYISQVADAGGKIIFVCPPKLIHLFSKFNGRIQFVNQGDPLPKFDVHTPLLSLPGIFKTTLATIPSEVGYIHVDEDLIESWNNKLSGFKKYKIGICWQGNKNHNKDRVRSIQLNQFSPLFEMDNVDFFSLQKGDGQEQIEQYQLSNVINDFTSKMDTLAAFSDTAAMIEQLDLIIGVDTATIHLAGAMGKPVWVLLSFNPDWRWMLKLENSPWYPSMRLFRQKEIGDWQSVMEQIEHQLKEQFIY